MIDSIVEGVALPTAPELGNNMIMALGDKFAESPKSFQPIDLWIAGLIGAVTVDDANYAALQLKNNELAEAQPAFSDRVRLTFAGWARYEDLRRDATDSRLAFMAMPFGVARLDNIFETCFKPAVEETGFRLERVDDPPVAGSIDNRLRVKIRRSRFLVSELTGGNLGAYWEAGFAEGLGRPVIYTCERAYFDAGETHFDTEHQLTILWSKDALDAAAQELKNTIRATLPGEARLEDPAQPAAAIGDA